ncbi:uncharacterized protein LOC104894822 isoform X3 [Beta vulgaris subsp. vulgaris]|uniref:uncharacterized protein LOC104894822 isoform X3 n=1 Tax=Beta vulgaris subsp. vulgaris TaxID=3555 RepID=UPI00053FFEAA|nr:uncharacterized protein LOC104894822 isoform X3 [Beta vulgaris subsp. vulgaris]
MLLSLLLKYERQKRKGDMFSVRSNWACFSKCLSNLQRSRRFCNFTTQKNKQQCSQSGTESSNGNNNGRLSDVRDLEAYHDLDNLNFMKAAKILFSSPPKKKQFGSYKTSHYLLFMIRLDFHLVQLFFALMPSLAVYLVAQYARYDIKKMEAELEVKKKAEEAQKAKEIEANEEEEKAAKSANPELLKVKERLEALEETVKEIKVETKLRPSQEISKITDQNQERVNLNDRSNDSHTGSKNQPTTQETTSGQSARQQDSAVRGSQEG